MKPLELIIYPPIQTPRYGYGKNHYGEQWKREMKLKHAKRLTDIELAAELHRAKWTGLLAEKYGGLSDEGRAKIATVERFASLPHYDEAAA